MSEKFYWHYHERSRGFAFARVNDRGVKSFFTAEYPRKERDAALEWLAYFVDGLAGCSTYEWWSLTDDFAPSDIYVGVPIERIDELRQKIAEGFGAIDLDEAARTGSPLGRAGGAEPPTPAAD